MTEVWRPVVGYEGLYDVSDQGRVRSLPRPGRKVHGIRILQQSTSNHGYSVVSLSKQGLVRQATVHSLVLTAFVSTMPEDMQACHGLGGIEDNSIGNLRWGTRSDNMKDQVRDGTHVEARKVRCERGHLLREPNLVKHNGPAHHRKCRSCIYARQQVARSGGDLLHAADNYYLRAILGDLL